MHATPCHAIAGSSMVMPPPSVCPPVRTAGGQRSAPARHAATPRVQQSSLQLWRRRHATKVAHLARPRDARQATWSARRTLVDARAIERSCQYHRVSNGASPSSQRDRNPCLRVEVMRQAERLEVDPDIMTDRPAVRILQASRRLDAARWPSAVGTMKVKIDLFNDAQ